MTVVGRVAALWRYPVKSMAGEELPFAEVSWNGLAGDRRWAFLRAGHESNGFPWLTIRDRPEMAHYRPRLTEPDRPDASAVLVSTPSGGELDAADPALAAELGAGVRVIRQFRGTFDTMPLSLMSTQTLDSLSALAGRPLAAARFRPNLLIDAEQPGFPEDGWVGQVLRIGGLRMRVDKRDRRCVLVTVDPVTLSKDPAILRAIARERDAQLGVYGSTVEPGSVAVGDLVSLEPSRAANLVSLLCRSARALSRRSSVIFSHSPSAAVRSSARCPTWLSSARCWPIVSASSFSACVIFWFTCCKLTAES
jgi:uncharacterized protein YcbX